MAISSYARRVIKHAIKDNSVGKEIADVVDAGSGTLSVAARTHMDYMMADRVMADAICDKIDAGTALTGPEQAKLGLALNDRVAATQIATELGS